MKMKNLLSAIAFAAVLIAVAADGDLLKFGCAYYPGETTTVGVFGW